MAIKTNRSNATLQENQVEHKVITRPNICGAPLLTSRSTKSILSQWDCILMRRDDPLPLTIFINEITVYRSGPRPTESCRVGKLHGGGRVRDGEPRIQTLRPYPLGYRVPPWDDESYGMTYLKLVLQILKSFLAGNTVSKINGKIVDRSKWNSPQPLSVALKIGCR